MAINLRAIAAKNATSEIEQGNRIRKEDIAGKWVTIERVGLVDKDKMVMGKPVVDENGEIEHLFWAQFRFKEFPDGYFRGFTALNNMVKEWAAEGTMEEINAELAANPIQIRVHPSNGNAWLFDLR